MNYVWIAMGAVAGANARYLVAQTLANRFGASFPFGTFVVNITGALLIGILLTLFTEIVIADPRWRLLLIVGFLGSYTTFSSYTYEAFALAERGDWIRVAIYVLGSNAIGLTAAIAGVVAARTIGLR